jgi:hypothetical protein
MPNVARIGLVVHYEEIENVKRSNRDRKWAIRIAQLLLSFSSGELKKQFRTY